VSGKIEPVGIIVVDVNIIEKDEAFPKTYAFCTCLSGKHGRL